jgi:heme/copper-type cytochrome/quinol oxidase subunit 3
VKDLTGSNSVGSAADSRAAAVARNAPGAQRWAREVLRRSVLELLYLGSNLAIAGGGLLWLYELLTRKPALETGLVVAAAVGISLFAYHFARWRASAIMSRQVEKLTASLIVTLTIALVWSGICCAFILGALRWFSVPGTVSWIVGGTAGFCGFAYTVAGEWSDLRDCLAIPASPGIVT